VAAFAQQRSGSNRAFERLYRRYVGDVYGYAYALLANPADAEDAAQIAFLNAYRAFRQGQPPEQPLNWLIAITHNVCRQRARDAARRPREVVLDRELAAEPAGDADGRFRSEDIRRALSQLAFNQRAALAMRELEGRSYSEIAEVLGISNSAVETLIFRARRAFREQLEGSLTCSEAERAISRQLDGMRAGDENAGLRAHLRACPECASLARRFRAQRAALKGIAIMPLPASLSSFSATVGPALGGALGGVGLKAAALGGAVLLAAGVGSGIVRDTPAGSAQPAARSGRAPARSANPSAARIASVLGRGREQPKLAGLRHKVIARGREQPVASPGRKLHPHPTAVLPAKAAHVPARGQPALALGSAIHRSGQAAAGHAGNRDSHAKTGGARPPEHAANPIRPAPPAHSSAQNEAGPLSLPGASAPSPSGGSPPSPPASAADGTPAHEPPAWTSEPKPKSKSKG
jgi:RNA polymerase sigma-70 factor, ECF subfamily